MTGVAAGVVVAMVGLAVEGSEVQASPWLCREEGEQRRPQQYRVGGNGGFDGGGGLRARGRDGVVGCVTIVEMAAAVMVRS